VDPSALLGTLATSIRESLARIDPSARVIVAAGRPVAGVEDVPTSFREAEQAAAAAPHVDDADDPRAVLTLRDVGIRGLIAVLKDDPRLQLFVEDSLGPLLNRAAANPSRRELLDALDAYLSERGNKSSAAARLHMSRPAFYSRLDVIEKVLG